MNAADDLAILYADFGETVTVDGNQITAIFDGGYIEQGVASTQPSLRCRASDLAGVAIGDTAVRGAVNYIIRRMEPLAPDELEIRLVLEKQ